MDSLRVGSGYNLNVSTNAVILPDVCSQVSASEQIVGQHNPWFYVGERVVRPALDAIWGAFRRLDTTLDKILRVIPGAHALQRKQPNVISPFKAKLASQHLLRLDWSHPLSALIDQLYGDIKKGVEDVINDAAEAEKVVILEAAKQLNIILQNMKVAYEDILEKTVDEVDKSVKSQLSHLAELVAEFAHLECETLEAFTKSTKELTQQLVNSLPYADVRPQLTEVSDSLALGSKSSQAYLSFSGNFVFIREDQCEPTLEISNKTYTPVISATTDLKFQVPAAALRRILANETDAYVLVPASLNVPWLDKGWVSTERKVAKFRVGFTLLPPSPGKMVVKYINAAKRIIKPIADGPHTIGQANGRNVRIQTFTDEGWKVVRNSASCDKPGYFAPVVTVTENLVICDYIFDRGEWGNVYIRFEEYKDVQGDEVSQPLEMEWGDQVILSSNENATLSSIQIDTFDGKHLDLAAPDHSNGYLDLSLTTDDRWIAKAKYNSRSQPCSIVQKRTMPEHGGGTD